MSLFGVRHHFKCCCFNALLLIAVLHTTTITCRISKLLTLLILAKQYAEHMSYTNLVHGLVYHDSFI